MPNVFKVLLIEDNADDEHLTLRALRKVGMAVEVEVARDGQQGLDRLTDADASLPDLVLMDLKLPKINGLDLLKRLRGDIRTDRLPIVVLSAADEPADVRNCHERYANGYLHKPVSPSAFLAVVEQLGILQTA